MINVLNVGCGNKPHPSTEAEQWVNLDYIAMEGVDLVFDLNAIRTIYDKLPGPCKPGTNERLSQFWPADYFDVVWASDVIEHVDYPIAVVQELGRVLKVGGKLWVRGPDGRYPEIVWADLSHKRAFAPRSFSGFDPETFDGKHYGHFHGPIKFKLTDVREHNKGIEFTLFKRG